MLRALAAALSLAVLVARCAPISGETEVSTASREGSIVEVRKGELRQTFLLTGVIDAAEGAVIAVPRLPNWQTSIKWLAADGVDVEEGEPVVELDNSSFSTDIEEKRRNEEQAVQQLIQKSAEAEADLAKKELEVEKKRIDLDKARIEARVPPEILPAKEYENRQLALRKAETELKKAESTLISTRTGAEADQRNLQIAIDKARREIQQTSQAMENLVLRAPAKGILVIGDHPWEGRKTQIGDSVWVGFPVARIPEMSSLQVVASLPDVDDGRVAVGMKAVVTLDSFPELQFPAEIVEIAPVAQEPVRQSLRRSFRLVARLEKIDAERMRPGLSAKLVVVTRVVAGATLVPRSAVDFSADPEVVFESGRRVAVTLGECSATECLVLEGLEPGARLLRTGR
ncbi:MAG TPA: efflux RND transporter periplasmic adaptor subunit [Thermoanaerobaculia bacterium]|nr:efflux RND transporter periplasmic adaptor subunit [Thermoanaerobaculia bacterium]